MKLYKEEPKRVYIAGPMAGLPNRNEDAFFEAEVLLNESGYETVNPARLTNEALLKSKGKQPTRAECYREDFRELTKCDAIYMLKGWAHSSGATLERLLALEMDLQIFYE